MPYTGHILALQSLTRIGVCNAINFSPVCKVFAVSMITCLVQNSRGGPSSYLLMYRLCKVYEYVRNRLLVLQSLLQGPTWCFVRCAPKTASVFLISPLAYPQTPALSTLHGSLPSQPFISFSAVDKRAVRRWPGASPVKPLPGVAPLTSQWPRDGEPAHSSRSATARWLRIMNARLCCSQAECLSCSMIRTRKRSRLFRLR